MVFNGDGMKIRTYKRSDREKIKKFISKILEQIFKSPASGLEDLEDIEKNFWFFLVVEKNGEIIGTVGIKKEGNNARISRMYVKKNERGRGIGTKLIQKALKHAEKNFKRIFFTTYKQMRSVGFYEKFGFKVYRENGNIIYMKRA